MSSKEGINFNHIYRLMLDSLKIQKLTTIVLIILTIILFVHMGSTGILHSNPFTR